MRSIDIPQQFHDINNRHKTFIENICRNETFHTLKSDEGYAFSETLFIDDDEGGLYDKMLFWSTVAEAELCRIEEWSAHEIETISLVQFIERWCIAISNEEQMIGTEPFPDMLSYEIDPLDLIIEILEELKRTGKTLSFSNFQGIDDLEKQVMKALER